MALATIALRRAGLAPALRGAAAAAATTTTTATTATTTGRSGGLGRGAAVRALGGAAAGGPPPSGSVRFGQGYDLEIAVPEVDSASQCPRKFRQLSNEAVFQLSMHGVHGACRERLVREIMRVDQVDWPRARERVHEMNMENDRYAHLVQLPYVIGITGGTASGLLSLPMVFHKPTVVWFAENVVRLPPEEIPVEELTTCWQVGGFAWGYMEPLLGTLSFVLLAAQFIRANMQNMGLHPYTNAMLAYRAKRLCRLYPQYDRNIVKEFAKTDAWHK